MGKRKLNATSFYQCDWTGFPMKQAFCYLPEWSSSGKLQKKGSYCNWESVVAHATFLLRKGELTEKRHEQIIEHITSLCGTVVESAPHYEELAHVKGRLGAAEFHELCTKQKHPITAVKITPQGEVFEVLVHGDIAEYLHRPYSYHGPPNSFHSMRKKGQKGPDRDLTVWYYGVKELPHNPIASNLFKMQLYGDVLLVQQSRENSFMPRERHVSFTKAQFDDQFNKKRKRQVDVQCMAPSTYAEVKAAMQDQLDQFEQEVSKDARPPAEISHVHRIDAASAGKALVAGLRAKGAAPSSASVLPPAQFLLPQTAGA